MAMLANLASSIIKHGSVRTTDAKAKEVRPFLERLVTFARRGDLHARRIVLSRLKGDQSAVKKLFDEFGPRYASRPGGYTRIIKLGFRQGDNSSMSLIEFVEEETAKKKPAKKAKSDKSKEKVTKEEEKAPEAAEAVETAEVPVEEAVATAEPAETELEETPEAPAETEEETAAELVETETPEVKEEKAQAETEEKKADEADFN